jgi:hypothetical protein
MDRYFSALRDEDLVLCSVPEAVTASIEVRNRALEQLGMGGAAGFEFLVSDVQRWAPGQTLRVAFLDGDSDLHRDIARAAQEIAESCGISFDFGEDNNGNYRRWTEEDEDYAAEIRVSFDKQGYFSLVGIDSIDLTVGAPPDRVGGRPNQASLNLGGFAIRKPATWQGTTRHEFLHAVGFHHAHQNMRGPCQAAFRWEDDQGYALTRDARGTFVADVDGRQPGIYTYLSGFPNFWSRGKVAHNLLTEERPDLVAGPFDRESVMLYRFPSLFYRNQNSICTPAGDGQCLSEGDKRGLRLLYPETTADRQRMRDTQTRAIEALQKAAPAAAYGLEGSGDRGMPMLAGVLSAIQRTLAAVG